MRVPFIVRWPGQVPAGRTDDRSVISGAGLAPHTVRNRGSQYGCRRPCRRRRFGRLARQGPHVRTKPLLWKTSAAASSACIREGRWKLTYPTKKRGGELELYDIEADPSDPRTSPESNRRS